jgi:hypothetical protein
MKKSYLSIFGAVLLLLNGCAATRSVQPAPDLSSLPLAQADMRAFDVGPSGSALPAQNKVVGEKWPAQVKHFIDQLVLLFGRHQRAELTTQEIESALGVKLTRQPYNKSRVDATYEISGSDLLWPERFAGAAEYRVGAKKKDGRRFHVFEFPIDAARFCVNPYDFAIYTGTEYMPEMPVHGFRPPDRAWPMAYEWGMFDRNSDGRFIPGKGSTIALITSKNCILKFRAKTNTFEEVIND